MRITTRGRYALRASLALARFYNTKSPVSINQLSEDQQISSVFLEQIFFKLRKAKIVNSVRGPGGGFQFAKNPGTITLKDILEAAGEGLNVTDCDKKAKTCSVTGKQCAAHTAWQDITNVLDNYLSTTTLTTVLEREIPVY
jgi:Rrf2 family iron-sulfur cluster assembly transcriptional regulator